MAGGTGRSRTEARRCQGGRREFGKGRRKRTERGRRTVLNMVRREERRSSVVVINGGQIRVMMGG